MAGVDVGEEAMEILDLSGVWRYQTDEEDTCQFGGERFPDSSFMLPGSACDNHVGKRQAYYERFSREAVRAPRERYEYIAPLWLQREIEIPEELEGKSVRLFLERVNIASELWFDDVKIARQNIELSAPHIYNLTGKITVGLHRITLRIDNRNLLNIGDMASGYSVDTQGYWNGIIGRIELQRISIILRMYRYIPTTRALTSGWSQPQTSTLHRHIRKRQWNCTRLHLTGK